LADPGSLLGSVLAPIEAMVSRGGYGGVFVAMLVENFLQFIPSEAIMPLAGYLASQGKLALVPTILAGTLGTNLGTFLWYLIGLYANEEKLEAAISRLGVWFGVTSAKLKKSRHWFNRHGHLMVFWGRLVPVLRTLVSIPAGMALMPMRSFLLWTSLGSLIWNALLTATGRAEALGKEPFGPA
jgi:alkaline phosphatase